MARSSMGICIIKLLLFGRNVIEDIAFLYGTDYKMEEKTAQRYFFAKCYYFGERESAMTEKPGKIRDFTGKNGKIPQNIREK